MSFSRALLTTSWRLRRPIRLDGVHCERPRIRSIVSSLRTSFITRAAAHGDARALIGPFKSAGLFDACLEDGGMMITSIGDGRVEASLVVSDALANNYGTLHGAAIATVVDVVGTLALLSVDPTRAGVSIEMNQSFCSAAKVGQRLVLSGEVLKYGRSLAFTEVHLRKNGVAGPLVAVGRHTKMFPELK
jgi:acyl-coenzyme A thioesterase 13